MIKPSGPSGGTVNGGGTVTASPRVAALLNEAGRRLVVVDAVPARLPPLVLGETVEAQVVQRFPNGRLLVQVKGGLLTLQLPAATGGADTYASPSAATAAAMPPQTALGTNPETLLMKVSALAPRLAFVLSASTVPASGGASEAVKLSESALYLTELLSSAPARAALAGRTSGAEPPALLANPLAPAPQRAESLAQAVRHSGLFYESHVRAWAEGRLPQDALQAEPQSRAGALMNDTSSGVNEASRAELGGLLQRQLDVLDGKPLAFAGFAWPGQPAEWQIQRDPNDDGPQDTREDDEGADPEHAGAWTTQLRLILPRLGALGAQVRVAGSNVQLAMTLGNGTSAGLFNAHRGRLEAALQAAGLNLASLTVRHDAAQEAP